AGDLTARVVEGKAANLKPTVDAVEAPDSPLEFVGLARRDRLPEDLDDVRQIFGMKSAVRAPLPHGLERLATELSELVVGRLDVAVRIEDDDQARNGVHDPPRLARALAQGMLGAPALDELTDLAAEVRHHVEQIAVGLADLTADQIDDAQDLGAEEDRKGKGRVKPVARGGARAEEGRVVGEIRDAHGCAARPGPARQTAPARKRARPSRGLELRGLDRRRAPQLRATENTRFPIQEPPRAEVPSHALAQGPEDPGHRFLDRDRFRQDPGGAVLREDSLPGTLALGQVGDEGDA